MTQVTLQNTPQTWLIAPDSFKGSISAVAFCEQVRAVRDALQLPVALIERPMSDGGEGFVEAFLHAGLAEKEELYAQDPLGRPVKVIYGWQASSRTAFVEMAQASGLPRLTRDERDPMSASSYGTGQVLAHAINKGARSIVLGLGGSATNDGGMGALSALGFEFKDGLGQVITSPAQLVDLAEVGFLPGLVKNVSDLQSLDWLLACDVTNPLLGDHGATAVFGPQKGVTPETAGALEFGLARLAEVLAQSFGQEITHLAGAGAAGGMAGGFVGALSARLVPGFELLAERLELASCLASQPIDGVITGEGKLDAQSLQGKLPVAMARLAADFQVPTYALCGRLEDTDVLKHCFQRLHSINDETEKGEPEAVAMQQAPHRFKQRLMQFWPQWLG
ncbi:glycerate kinase [Hydrogenovibrio halophilus]|uniref:glycerate kinase n=1 Tax=Hydrogenovibrio halophilus TaxID=373391 RepID=UPI00036FD1EC|nr:glycerate kinase [Hydrogenovibrio halophilus]